MAPLDAVDRPLVVVPDGTPGAMVAQTVEALAPENRSTVFAVFRDYPIVLMSQL